MALQYGLECLGGALAALIDLPAAAKEAVKGEANCFVVHEVHRSAAETLDGLRCVGYRHRESRLLRLFKRDFNSIAVDYNNRAIQ